MPQPKMSYWSWTRTIPQVLVIVLLIFLFHFFLPVTHKPNSVLWGVASYFAYAYSARFLIPRWHRLGVKAFEKKQYDVALSHFERSFEFFSSHAWLDRYRGFVIMTPSAWSYREMALINVVSVHAAKGDIDQTRKSCVRLLKDYPENDVAKRTLTLIEAETGGN